VTSPTALAPRAQQRSAYVPELDGIRGLAITGVMALHFVGAITPVNLLERAALKISSYGLWGVDLFFVLSGFLITGILADSKGAPAYFRNFYIRRGLRIFPLYYGLLLLFVLIPAGVLERADPGLLEARSEQWWLWSYLTNFHLASQTSFSLPYFSHFWSLAVEEHFYLFWPVLILLLSRPAAMRACLCLTLASLAARMWFAVTVPDQLAAGVLTWCRLDALSLGGWFALAARGVAPLQPAIALRGLGVSATVVVGLSLWHLFQLPADPIVLSLRTSALAVLFGFFIYSAARHPGLPQMRAALRARPLRMLGRYSYGLYVFHGLVSYALHQHSPEAYLTNALGNHTVAALVQVGLGVGLSFAVAVTSYEFFESKFLALKSRFSHEGPPPSVAPSKPRVAGLDSLAEPTSIG
jgi:peptidoglycan/LPS O-acetylase OafA/YrhL